MSGVAINHSRLAAAVAAPAGGCDRSYLCRGAAVPAAPAGTESNPDRQDRAALVAADHRPVAAIAQAPGSVAEAQAEVADAAGRAGQGHAAAEGPSAAAVSTRCAEQGRHGRGGYLQPRFACAGQRQRGLGGRAGRGPRRGAALQSRMVSQADPRRNRLLSAQDRRSRQLGSNRMPDSRALSRRRLLSDRRIADRIWDWRARCARHRGSSSSGHPISTASRWSAAGCGSSLISTTTAGIRASRPYALTANLPEPNWGSAPRV